MTTKKKARPEMLTDDEREYLAEVVDKAREANAALQSWGGYLTRKYRLSPDDGIDPTGLIIRGNGGGTQNGQ